ncbi:MAG: sulfatase [Deltaproteobacteria bacterium]|nr:sulfatase [Deltaproteobacteria bacterium]
MRIVLIIADSLRADAPGFAGGDCNTPVLDQMAEQGVWFHHATTSAAWTVPSIASILTGLWAHRLGLYRWEQPLPSHARSLFGAMADQGYQVASFVFDPDYLFVSVPEAGVVGSSQDVERMIGWLQRCTSSNLFVVIHVWSTHFPYVDRPLSVRTWKRLSDEVLGAWQKDPSVVGPKVRALYRRGVERFSERLLPRIVSAVREHAGSERCLVVVTGDHGESWGERGQAPVTDVFDLHGNHLHEEVLSVPLLLWGPEWLEPRPIPGAARSVDIAPTLAAIAGASLPGADGVSLADCVQGQGEAPSLPSLSFASRDFVSQPEPVPSTAEELWKQVAFRTGSWKLIWTPSTAEQCVYRLDVDPGERNPLARGSGEPAEAWEEIEKAWREAKCAPAPDLAAVKLRRLGYIE